MSGAPPRSGGGERDELQHVVAAVPERHPLRIPVREPAERPRGPAG